MWRILAVVSAVALGTAGCKAPSSATAELVDRDVDSLVRTFMAERGIVGMGVGIVVDGEVAYVGGYGFEDRDLEVPVDPLKTKFRWASISKTLTAVAVLTLEEIGALDLDDQVLELYPAYVPPPGSPGLFGLAPVAPSSTTVRHLLNHNSGIRHYSNGQPGVSVTPPTSQRNYPTINTGFEWAFPLWTGEPLLFAPGTGFAYSTPAFNLLGAVVGAVQNQYTSTNQSVDAGYVERVDGLVSGTAAQGLRHDYYWDPISRRSKGYLVDDDDVTNVSDDGNSDVSWKLPAGGFLSSTRVLAEYCALLMGPELLSASTRAEVYTPGLLGTGRFHLGFYVDTRNFRTRVSHRGSQQKVRSHLAFYPDDRLGFVAFSNTGTDSEDEPFWVELFGGPDPPFIRVSELVDQLEDLVRARLANGEPAIQPES